MKLNGLSHLLVEQVAVIAALVAYLTGIVSVRPQPSLPKDLLAFSEAPNRLVDSIRTHALLDCMENIRKQVQWPLRRSR